MFAYTGRLLDQYTGLQNNLNRWYDASMGRWLSEDPIGFAAGDANLYRYVGNGPVNGTDPSELAVSKDNEHGWWDAFKGWCSMFWPTAADGALEAAGGGVAPVGTVVGALDVATEASKHAPTFTSKEKWWKLNDKYPQPNLQQRHLIDDAWNEYQEAVKKYRANK